MLKKAKRQINIAFPNLMKYKSSYSLFPIPCSLKLKNLVPHEHGNCYKEFKGWKTDIRCKEKRRIASKTAHFPRFKIIVICL
jgi:hypothetical protein